MNAWIIALFFIWLESGTAYFSLVYFRNLIHLQISCENINYLEYKVMFSGIALHFFTKYLSGPLIPLWSIESHFLFLVLEIFFMDPWWFLLPWLTLGIPEFTQVRYPMAISRPLSLEMSLSVHVQIVTGRSSWFPATDSARRAKCPASSPLAHVLLAGRTSQVKRSCWNQHTGFGHQLQATESGLSLVPRSTDWIQKIIWSVLIGFQTHYLINLDISIHEHFSKRLGKDLSLISFSLLSNSILNSFKKSSELSCLVFYLIII